MNALRSYTVTLQDMRTLEEKHVDMYAVSSQAAADGARQRQDCPDYFAVIRADVN
jgi:hypothetical protein